MRADNAVEFSSELRIFVDFAAGSDVELALRREEKRPKAMERHTT